ncbi:hypothetical protein ACLZH7_17300 [Streptomyces sp. BG2AG]|uniref:hypothetical protein n=1 Tax=unclassified Streptomyces TaxID=2593676 RepID=UPI001C974AA2|nr:hypothetical protein [Streptomyces cavourensis]
MLDAGLRQRALTAERTTVHVLAAPCAQHATWLDETVRRAVRESTAALFPPAADREVAALARLGQAALAFLPDPRMHDSEESEIYASYSASPIMSVGGAPAIPHARVWALAHPWLGSHFANGWERFPPEEYAAEVLAHCDLQRTVLTVSDRKQLRALRHLPSVFALSLRLDLSDAELGAALRDTRLEGLFLRKTSRLAGLSFLSTVAGSLSVLDLGWCPALRDSAPLTGLGRLEILFLDAEGIRTADPAPLADLPALWRLRPRNLAADRLRDRGPPRCHPSDGDGPAAARPGRAPCLEVPQGTGGLRTRRVRRRPRRTAGAFPDQRSRPHRLPLGAAADPPGGRAHHPGTVRAGPRPRWGSRGAAPALPRVTHLRLDASARRVLDLTPLHSWPGLRVQVNGLTRGRLIGAEELGDRLNASPG